MRNLRSFSQKPLGQSLLATLLFCFIFLALFVGLFKAGSAYVVKERARRATNLTALTGGSVYANGLELVRESNWVLSFAVAFDIGKAGLAAAAAFEGGPAAMLEAAYLADKGNSRTVVQKFQNIFLGVDIPGIYPFLIEAQALASATDNHLSFIPAYAYNYETATSMDVIVPNLALRFRTASEFLPNLEKAMYSLEHNGVRYYFSSDKVEPAHNPRNPNQMRVKKDSGSEFAGWWVKKEKNGVDSGNGSSVLSKYVPTSILRALKKFLDDFKFDVTDRDDPPCHTFTLISKMPGEIVSGDKNFYQASEVRVETDGLAAWDIGKPYDIYLQKVDLASLPGVRDVLNKLGSVPVIGQIMKSSDIINGL